MLNHALRYQKMGLSVIPIKEKGKEPLIPWKEFQQRLASEEEITQWWTNAPNANIGVVTGSISGIVVVDLDGLEGLKSAESMGLKSSSISFTGTGKHLWFKHPGSLVPNAVRFIQGVDVRGDGGYVCAPPSVHPNGKRYRWLGAGIRCIMKTPLFPVSVCAGSKGNQEFGKNKESGWIAKALEEMKIGNIDNTLVSVLGRLRHDGYSKADAFALLRGPSREAGAIEGHLEEKIENIWTRYEPKKSVINVSDNEEAEGINEFLETTETTEWIVNGLIAKNSIGFVVGLPESNKTWLCMDLAVEAAIGGNWIGLFPVRPTKTLFVDQERWSGETRRRFRALIKAKGLTRLNGDSLNIKCGSSIKIDLEQSYNAFVRLLERLRPELVIIDSLATFHNREENSRSEIQTIMEKIKVLREQFNCTFLFIHHSNKFAFQAAKEGQEPTVAEMAGSIALPAAAETVLTVQKQSGGGSTVFHTKSTLAQKAKSFGIVVEDTATGIQVRGIK